MLGGARKAYEHFRQFGADATARQIAKLVLDAVTPPTTVRPGDSTARLVHQRFLNLAPLRLRTKSRDRGRLNLVTDTINPPHLYGGVGTALIFGALLAERMGIDLRIITRHAPAQPENFDRIMEVSGVKPSVSVDFAFSAFDDESTRIDAGDDELYLTTSWWTTHGTRQAVSADRILYLLQEDERMFYPYGDEHLRCTETLSDKGLAFLINTELLFDHLVGSGFENLTEQGMWFEPSFPAGTLRTDGHARARKQFLYYARPNNVRNLFCRGIEAIDVAIGRGILDPAEWDINFVGKEIPSVRFPKDVSPRFYENLSWPAYTALVRKMDLGLCLMYTPHPSYPPLDLAAAGGVVVTNRFGRKTSLDRYSKNIICVDPSVDDLVRGIEEGTKLAADGAARLAHHGNDRILRDWRTSFAQALDGFSAHFGAR